MKKNIQYLLILIIILIIGFISIKIISKSTPISNTKSQETQVVPITEEKQPENKITTLYFVGDMMFDRGVESSVKKNFNGDFNKLFENLSDIKNADILFGNLEGPASDVGKKSGSIYSFQMDPLVIPAIKNAGFDVVSFANNHVGDFSDVAFKDTLARLDNEGILKAGAGMSKDEAESPVIIEKNGVKFGFLAFSDVGPAWMEAKEDKPGILLASDPLIREIIKNAKDKSDVLIVSFHFGDEYKTIHNKRQQDLARMAVDYGADMVVGHHPHVMEDIEIYKDKPIVYSLGNFIFDQSFSKDTMKGMLFKATFEGSSLLKTDSKVIILNKKFQPEGIFNKEEVKDKEESMSSVCPKPSKDYGNLSLLPVGQYRNIPDKNYTPEDLREIKTASSTKSGICLTKEARDSFEIMTDKARVAGLNIKASSGFRSYNYQNNLMANALASGNQNAEIAIAKAGYSEHQLGVAIDVTGQTIKYDSASKKFDKTAESKWMEENASDYGFVESYPSGKQSITGYMYEPWHYRYVGIDIAKEILLSGKTTIEYLESLEQVN